MNSNDIAITVSGIGKRYRIGLKDDIQETFGGIILDFIKSPLKNFRKYRSLYVFNDHDTKGVIWSLKDVSFELKRGEVLGVIGRNGAGKSTLLKILSRVTDPTKGYAEIHGRVSSLLEVGTGFHPELTGRENVYLNAIILGMSKKEVDKKFDEIVEFSEIGKFIDTPVKRYSSGMKVRLAFSVSAHLEPEILIVDEVLAVGDTAFQRKCIGKMENVSRSGKTVLFVSHNMAAIQALCTRGILLEKGCLINDLPAGDAVQEYIRSVQKFSEDSDLSNREDRIGGQSFRFTNVEFLDPDTLTPINLLISGQPMLIRIKYSCDSEVPLKNVNVSISFFLSPGVFLFSCRSDVLHQIFTIAPGDGELICEITKCPLMAGRYSFNLFANMPGTKLDVVREAGFIDIEKGDYFGTGRLPEYKGQGVLIDYKWRMGPENRMPA
jgi:lipopolysaccharide transport system ATP-binding protein